MQEGVQALAGRKRGSDDDSLSGKEKLTRRVRMIEKMIKGIEKEKGLF